MTLDLDEIERRASAATPGEWAAIVDCRRACRWRVDAPDAHIADIPQSTRNPHPIFEANAAHIAGMSPTVTLALVARIRELEGALGLALGVSSATDPVP